MSVLENPVQLFLGLLLILASLGVIIARKPIHASLSFMLALLTLAALFTMLSAEFIAVLQILVYAGAILVIFVFVIVLFQDAYLQIDQTKSLSAKPLIAVAGLTFLIALISFGALLLGKESVKQELPEGFGTVQGLGKALYIDFFFPFEAVILLFLVAVIGSLYIAKKEI
jgi:NADH-quinone oxidoreductase subunit J